MAADWSRKPGTVAGDRCILPEPVVERLLRDQPLVAGMLATAAGYLSWPPGRGPGSGPGAAEAAVFTLVYCVRGSAWCELGGRPQPVRSGDLLLFGPEFGPASSLKAGRGCVFHWVCGRGALVAEYFRQLDANAQPLLRVGDDPHLVRLFNEIREALGRANAALVLPASQALGYLLASLIARRRQRAPENPDTARKIAAAIVYMSEHLERPLRVSALACAASLSPAYFTEVFRAQAGCAPRDYLRLLRIHRACQLLQGTGLSIKEIATRTGYQDPFHFSRQFKAFQGDSPSLYRARQAGGGGA